LLAFTITMNFICVSLRYLCDAKAASHAPS